MIDLKTLPLELKKIIDEHNELYGMIDNYLKKGNGLDMMEIIGNILTDYDDAWNVEGRPDYQNWTGPYSKELYNKLNAFIGW